MSKPESNDIIDNFDALLDKVNNIDENTNKKNLKVKNICENCKGSKFAESDGSTVCIDCGQVLKLIVLEKGLDETAEETKLRMDSVVKYTFVHHMDNIWNGIKPK